MLEHSTLVYQVPFINILALEKLSRQFKTRSSKWREAIKDIRTISKNTSLAVAQPGNQPSTSAYSKEWVAKHTLSLLDKPPTSDIPSISLTPAMDASPTMSIDTWLDLGGPVWGNDEIKVTLPSTRKPKHVRSNECIGCTTAAKTNAFYSWKMFKTRKPTDFDGYWTDRKAWEERQGRVREEKDSRKTRRGPKVASWKERMDSAVDAEAAVEIQGVSER